MLKRYKQSTHNTGGYTLVEVLIATAVFAMIVVLILDIFLLFLRMGDDDIDQRNLESDVAFMVQQAQRNLRELPIDYSHSTFTSGSNPRDILYFNDHEGYSSAIALGSHPDMAALGADPERMYVLSDDGISPFITPLTEESTTITRLEIFAYPDSDPYELTLGSPATNFQQAIVLYIEAEDSDNSNVNVQAQTMITSRNYER